MNETDALILLSLIFGCICLVWRGKRQFKRLNKLSIEQFSSYGHKIGATIFETILLGSGYGLLGVGGLISLLEYAQPFMSVMFLLAIVWIFQETFRKSRK